MNNVTRRITQNRFIEFLARYILALTFIYASYHKIVSPGEFAKLIYGYGLFPGQIINLTAIILPYIELIAGVALITGYYDRGANLILIGMLILFMTFISINLIRGHEFDCGCFVSDDFFSHQSAWQTLLRDIILLAIGWYCYQFKVRKILVFNQKDKP